MNYKNKFIMLKRLLSIAILIFFTVPLVSCTNFNPDCNITTIDSESINNPVIISIFYEDKRPLPEKFTVKVNFDNDVFKKNAKINYNPEVSRNYKHNKNIYGNEIYVCCSLKNGKIAPIIPKNQEIFSLTLECKKSIKKPETILKITSEYDSENENTEIPMKIHIDSLNVTPPKLKNLIPDSGLLEPPFNPDITEYSVFVPHDTKDIKFETNTETECSTKVNRHKLQSPGSTTDIYITVNGTNKGSKNIYHVSVKRDPAPEKSTSKRSAKENSSKKQKSHSKNISKKYDCSEQPHSTEVKSPVLKKIEFQKSEKTNADNKKLYYILVFSSITVISAVYVFINRQKIFKNKISLNKTSKK